jgi:hypothetical protein
MSAGEKRERDRDDERGCRDDAGPAPSSQYSAEAIAETLSAWCEKKDPTLLRDKVESQSFTIVDTQDPIQPITFVSEGFLDMSGYSRDEIVGHNCRFLQG